MARLESFAGEYEVRGVPTMMRMLLLFHTWIVKSLSHVQLFATPWTIAYQDPATMGFSRQEYWSGLRFPSAGDLPDPGIEPRSPALQADASPSEPPGKGQFIKRDLLI